MLVMSTKGFRWPMFQANAYLYNSADKERPLHEEIRKNKGTMPKRGRSCMGQAEDVIQRMRDLEDITPGEEQTVLLVNFLSSFRVFITLVK